MKSLNNHPINLSGEKQNYRQSNIIGSFNQNNMLMRTTHTENTYQQTYLTFSQEPSMMNTPIELIEDDLYSEIIPQFQVDTTSNTFNNTKLIEEELKAQQNELKRINDTLQKLTEKKQRRMEKQNKIDDFFNKLLKKETASSQMKRQKSNLQLPSEQKNCTFRPSISPNSQTLIRNQQLSQERIYTKRESIHEKLHKEYVMKKTSIQLQQMLKQREQEEFELQQCTFTPRISRNSREITGAIASQTRRTIDPDDFYYQEKQRTVQKQNWVQEQQLSANKRFTFKPDLTSSRERIVDHSQFNKSLMSSKGFDKFIQRQHEALKNRLELQSMYNNMGLSKCSSQLTLATNAPTPSSFIQQQQAYQPHQQQQQQKPTQKFNFKQAQLSIKQSIMQLDTNNIF